MYFSKVKALYLCTALMIIMVSVNFENALGDFDFKGWYIGFLLSIPLVIRNLRLTSSTVSLIIVIAIPSISGFVSGSYVSFKGLFTSFLFISLVIYARALIVLLGYENLIRLYAKVGLILAIFVILNQCLYIVSPNLSYTIFGVTEITSIFTRAKGLFLEPSEVAIYLTPALVYYSLNRHHKYSSIILVAMIATFSTLVYFAIVLSFLFISYLLRVSASNWARFAIVGALLFAVATTSEQIVSRFDSVARFMSASSIEFEDYNSSIATVIMNSIVAKDSLFDTYFLGMGFGNFEYGFNLFAKNYFPAGYDDTWGLFWNRNTGGNLIIRLTAELGIFGILLMLYVLVRAFKAYFHCRSKGIDGEFVCSRNLQAFIISAVVILLICLLRKDSVTNVHLAIFLVGMLMFAKKKRVTSGSQIEHLKV